MKKIVIRLIMLLVTCAAFLGLHAEGSEGFDIVRYEKVTDASQLDSGDVFIIVCEKYNVAMGQETSSNFGEVAATVSDGFATASGANEITLDNTRSKWALKTGNSFLCAKSGQSDGLTTESTLDNKGFWKATIKIEDGNAIISFKVTSSGRNYTKYIRYSSNKFTCYYNAQGKGNLVQIYKKKKTVHIDNVNVTVGTTHYATLYYSDRALTVPDSCTAYTYTMLDGTLTVSKEYSAGDIIPASTGFVIYALEPGKYTFKAAASSAGTDSGNMLRGSDTDAQTEGGAKYYKLSTLNGTNIGFYWGATDGDAFTNKAHKAYLAVPESEATKARRSYVFGKKPTGITSVSATNDSWNVNAPMYNLAGQRVDKAYKGIVICNGRTFLLK